MSTCTATPDNYKVWNTCVVCGEITEQQKETIINSLDGGEYFIPSKVGLPEKRFENYDAEVDHDWFELQKDGFDDTRSAPDRGHNRIGAG